MRLLQERVVHAKQGFAESNTTGIVVEQKDPGIVILAGLIAAVDGNSQIMTIAHEKKRGHVPYGIRQPHDAIAPIVGRKRKRGHQLPGNRQPVRRRVHLLLWQIQLS
jgi:hypothetical protein